MSTDDQQVEMSVETLGADESLEKAAETTQLEDRYAGRTPGGGISPPYPPARLAALQELNGTHAIAIGKKASREVGFGFDIVSHDRADDPSEEERDRAEDFWHGRDTIWKIGPQGTVAGSPTEVFELARRDWHGIGWAAIELIYGDDNTLQGLAHVPAVEVRVKKAETQNGLTVRGHGYVQEDGGNDVYYGEAGDRVADDPTYVDRDSGETSDSIDGVDEVANELLFIPNPSPLTKYYGIPDWVAEIQTMVADQEARRFNREFFEYDAMPQYAVLVEGGTLTESSRADVRDLVKNLQQKEGRRVAVLEAQDLADHGIDTEGSPTITIEPLSQQGDEDMSFVEYRKLNEHDVAKVHEVPPQLIGRLESSNRSNSKEAVRDFIKTVIQPAQERFAERLYRVIHQQVLDIQDWRLEFRTVGAENEQREADIARTEIGPEWTINEARERLGLDPKEELEGVLIGEAFNPEVGGQPRSGEIADEIVQRL
jgi:PBSX family phage portal protein